MPDSIEHERYRWSYMTIDQLSRRLSRIQKPEKIENFLQLAGERRLGELFQLALARADKLGYSDLYHRYEGDLRNLMAEQQHQVDEAMARASREDGFAMSNLAGAFEAAAQVECMRMQLALNKLRFAVNSVLHIPKGNSPIHTGKQCRQPVRVIRFGGKK